MPNDEYASYCSLIAVTDIASGEVVKDIAIWLRIMKLAQGSGLYYRARGEVLQILQFDDP